VVVLALVAVPSTSALASATSSIDSALLSTLQKVGRESNSTAQSDVAYAIARLKPCLSAADSDASAPAAAVTALTAEATVQLSANSIRTPLDELDSMSVRIASLVPRSVKPTSGLRALIAIAPAVTAMRKLNFCQDFGTWNAAGYASAHEPAGVRAAAGLDTELFALVASIVDIGKAVVPKGDSAATALRRAGASAGQKISSDLTLEKAALAALVSSGTTGSAGA